ncbi:fibrinogen-like protein A isoform X1 [Mytilus trossulus]|uniref:fibrinogen-like protein A isoform X1 n=1 Tax=Mytilus trossulus TaxID=6551 RepID=UPI003005CE38
MASIEMSAYEDIKREDHTYDVIKKQIETKHEFKPSLKQWLFLFILILTLLVLSGVVVWTVTYFTVRGTMEIQVQEINTDMDAIEEKLEKMHNDIKCIGLLGLMPKDCSDWCISKKTSEFITVYFDSYRNVAVLCEKGGWTVIQKRFNGAVEFHRNWKDYENGFGDLHGEFWLGNKNIAQLTSEGNHELRINVEDWDRNKRYAVYRSFSIGNASTKYRLNISNYSGNAGDGMSQFNGMKFSTYDQDNDKYGYNCADHVYFKGGWWFNNCWNSNNAAILNGHYTHRNNTSQGIIYKLLKKTSLKKSTMKIRRL